MATTNKFVVPAFSKHYQQPNRAQMTKLSEKGYVRNVILLIENFRWRLKTCSLAETQNINSDHRIFA